MKSRKSVLSRFHTSHLAAALALAFTHFAAPSAFAQTTYYWDSNGTTGGFGTAAGTWAEPTTGSATQGWSEDAAGATVPVDVTTTTSDAVRFGTGALGLGAGTITVAGTVDAASLAFDDNNGNITLSGGTINLGDSATINNGGKTNTMNSALSGAATSLAFSGGGTMIFTGSGAAGFGAEANATVSGVTLRFSSGGNGALGGATGFNINLGGATSSGTLHLGNSVTVANPITVMPGTGGRFIGNSGNPGGAFSGNITANENLSVNWSSTNNGSISGAASTIATGKTVTFTASNSGTLTNSAIFGGSGAITYAGSAGGNITASGAKTYSGGTTLSAMSGTGAVVVNTSSTGPANAPDDGAFGTGTLTIAGTKIRAGTAADITVGNAVTFTGNPTFSTIASEKSLIFTGNASLGATRTLTVETGNTVPGEFVEFSGNITGAFGITKAGVGVLRFSGAKSYSGATTLSAGKLVGVVGGNCSSSTVNLSNVAATLGVAVSDNTLSWTCSALTASAAGVLEFNFGAVAPSTTVSPLAVTNAAAFTEVPSVSVVVDTALALGTYPLMTWGSTSGTAPTAVTISNLTEGTFASLSVSGNTLNLVIDTGSNSVIKGNNATALNDGNSWVGLVAPDSTKIVKWNSIVDSANTTVLGADVTWSGIAIENPAGLVTINAGHTLTLGTALIDIDLSTADTADLTLNCPLAMDGTNIWDVAASRTVTLGGQVSGAFDVTKQGAGTAILSSPTNSYTGTTTVSAGTLRLGTSDVIPDGASIGNVAVNGTLDLNGNSETVNGLSGAGIIDNLAATTTSTLTVGGNGQTSTFNGILQNSGDTATLNLIKTGTGALTLASANTLGGSVAVTGGTLAFSNANPFANVSGISLAGGTALRPAVVNAAVSAPITLGATGTTATITAPSVPGGGGTTAVPFTLGGVLSGDGNVTFSGVENTNAYGTIILNAASTYAGSTLITCTGGTNNNIFVRLGVADALPASTVLTLDGGDGGGSGRFCDLNLNGKNQTLAGLTNVTGRTSRTQRVRNSSATPATLTVNNTDPYTYAAQLGDSGTNLGLTKGGLGTLTLTGSLSYAGDTTVSEGLLSLGSANTANDLSKVTIAASGAKLALTFAGTDTVAKLVIGTTPQVDGIYGHTDSGATNGGLGVGVMDPYFEPGSGTLTVLGGFSSWIKGTFAGGATVPADKQGANDDPDNDGIRNLVEYAVDGQDPTVPNAAVGTFTGLSLSFTKRPGTSGLTYAIQESTDLGASDVWAEVPVGPSYVNGPTTISYTLPGGPAKDFARLQVTSP